MNVGGVVDDESGGVNKLKRFLNLSNQYCALGKKFRRAVESGNEDKIGNLRYHMRMTKNSMSKLP
jgi:hypothetical protein